MKVGRLETTPAFAPVEPASRPVAQADPLVPLDPQGHGPFTVRALRSQTRQPRVEAPWSARAKALASEALRAAEHLSSREAVGVALEAILNAPELRGTKVGVGIEDRDGLLFARDLDAMVNPASNAKLCTATFALGVLGPQHRFLTELRRDGDDHYLIGAFDPSFTTATLDEIAAALIAKGVRAIEGDLILDLSRFQGSRDPAGFDRYGDQDWQYLARPEALSVNKNLLGFRVLPGAEVGAAAIVEGDQRAFELRPVVETIEPGAKFRIGIDEQEGQPIIDVSGTIALDYAKGKKLVMKSPDPRASFADELRRAFERAGIRIEGSIRTGVAPGNTEPVLVHRSRPLAELLKESIATSNAFDHEMYALAAAAKLAPGGRTSLSDARARMEQFLVAELGLGAPELANASGIGNLNRISAGDVLKLLGRASRDLRYATLLEALARPGEPGTLATRMLGTAAEGSLRAKTGTGDDAVALSGTIGKGRRALRFSVLVDDHASRDGARAVLDAIGIVLSELGSRRPERPVKRGRLGV